VFDAHQVNLNRSWSVHGMLDPDPTASENRLAWDAPVNSKIWILIGRPSFSAG
jgi:hypothetical protein